MAGEHDPVEGYLPIADYGIIGDLHTVALVGKNGSIDWCCIPCLDAPTPTDSSPANRCDASMGP